MPDKTTVKKVIQDLFQYAKSKNKDLIAKDS
jgi:hypothetical protein